MTATGDTQNGSPSARRARGTLHGNVFIVIGLPIERCVRIASSRAISRGRVLSSPARLSPVVSIFGKGTPSSPHQKGNKTSHETTNLVRAEQPTPFQVIHFVQSVTFIPYQPTRFERVDELLCLERRALKEPHDCRPQCGLARHIASGRQLREVLLELAPQVVQV